MNDPRLSPDPQFGTATHRAQVIVPVTDLCRSPKGPRDRQLLMGDTVAARRDVDGWTYVQSVKDNYCGHVKTADLGPDHGVTHRIAAAASHCYPRPDMKSPERFRLSHGCQTTRIGTSGPFAETHQGFIPLQHIKETGDLDDDPAQVAALYLGTPYLWGGNSRDGIDCSGLVQAACLACGITCPGDSDMQEAELGHRLAPNTVPQRNDLLFWKGHVALVFDPETLLHANAHSMSVSFEPLKAAIDRIANEDAGPVTAHKRLR